MCNGKRKYAEMYKMVQTLNTNNDAEVCNDGNSTKSSQSILTPVLLNFDTHIWYVSGEHFTISMCRCPTKTLTTEYCSGRFILDLSKQTVANI